MNLNSSPNSPSPINDVDHNQRHRALNLGPVVSSPSSSSASRHFFFSSTQDHAGFYRHQLYHQQDDSYLYHGGSSYEIKKKVESNLRLALWNREDINDNRVKWISTNNDRVDPTVGTANAKIDRYSSSFETDTNSNISLYTPIRVCSDCHTTKTPLWRSGPKGPKSLCNACGIRQRKARRASGTVVVAHKARPMKIKVGRSSQFKKRCKMADANAGGSISENGGSKKLGFEDFLINLSNKLALQRVFPQDEKDAAILLMALSSGLLHA